MQFFISDNEGVEIENEVDVVNARVYNDHRVEENSISPTTIINVGGRQTKFS
jgi:hypothetical protein